MHNVWEFGIQIQISPTSKKKKKRGLREEDGRGMPSVESLDSSSQPLSEEIKT